MTQPSGSIPTGVLDSRERPVDLQQPPRGGTGHDLVDREAERVLGDHAPHLWLEDLLALDRDVVVRDHVVHAGRRAGRDRLAGEQARRAGVRRDEPRRLAAWRGRSAVEAPDVRQPAVPELHQPDSLRVGDLLAEVDRRLAARSASSIHVGGDGKLASRFREKTFTPFEADTSPGDVPREHERDRRDRDAQGEPAAPCDLPQPREQKQGDRDHQRDREQHLDVVVVEVRGRGSPSARSRSRARRRTARGRAGTAWSGSRRGRSPHWRRAPTG